jgi:hypothetical protein
MNSVFVLTGTWWNNQESTEKFDPIISCWEKLHVHNNKLSNDDPWSGLLFCLEKDQLKSCLHQLQSSTHGTILVCVNGCFGVEHKQKSSDYRPLMNAVNRCERTHQWCQWASRYLQHILACMNRGVGVESPVGSINQETLVYSQVC